MPDGAIYNQIEDAVKADINEQIEYLARMAVNDSYDFNEKERFKALMTGAKTVLEILARDPVLSTGTKAWLNNLSRDQLEYARDQSIELLTAMDAEARVKIWCVYSDRTGQYHFADFEAANIKLLAIIEADNKARPDKGNEFTIKPVMVRESEVKEYLTNS